MAQTRTPDILNTQPEQLFATANATLLAPYALDSQRLQTVFGQMLTHRVDYGDL